MAALLIPTSAVPYYSQRVKLDGRDYLLRFAYNEREARWYLSLYDDEELPLVLGLKLMTNWELLQHYHADPRVPPGELWVMCLSGDESPPTLSELGEGKRCELTYFDLNP
jgi:hypothetical protein